MGVVAFASALLPYRCLLAYVQTKSNLMHLGLRRGQSTVVAGRTGGHYLLDSEPKKKKKYAKEAWPGKKPSAHLLI